MTLIDSAEDAEPRVLAATMILPGRGVIDSVAPPISGLADFVEGMAAALEELE
jgi:hypothetical protein